MNHLLGLVVVFHFPWIGAEKSLDFSDIDVAKLATHTYGTELLLLEKSRYSDQETSYKFEDFFWTGSGDGEDSWTSEEPSVVYKTSTVISTIFIETPTTQPNIKNQTPTSPTTNNCGLSLNCTNILPTPTLPNGNHENNENNNFSNADQQFWLLTVLKGDGKDPAIIDLKNSLAKLYKTAFQRQQARHLGIVRQKRELTERPVSVYIHEINKQNDQIQVLYHVEMRGKPVDANTAADDMRLVSDEEVVQELGYPFVIKAEPYVKSMEPQGLSKAKSTWFVIGGTMIGLLVLLLIMAFLLLGFTKKKRTSQPLSVENKRHIFERGVGHENKGLVNEEDTTSENLHRDYSPTYIHYDEHHVNASVLKPQRSLSGTSSSSSSLDISPLMTLGKKRVKSPIKKHSRPRAALNKTAPINKFPAEVLDSDSNSSGKDDQFRDFEGNYDPDVMSPKSFLSMPSVKSFPRTNMPEPLNRVLEPVSITNLDMPDGSECIHTRYQFTRHGSVGTMEDPGVIGPVVWNIHSECLRRGLSVDQGINDIRVPKNISRMRKRFHDLLDDTFSLFGNSRKGSPVTETPLESSRPIEIEVKSHSANRLIDDKGITLLKPRPKTTGNKPSSKPSYAWSSATPVPFVRPLSAAPKIQSGTRAQTAPGDYSEVAKGILKPPRVNVEHVLAEGKFKPTDPAISVIDAIKTELEKVSLPGSSNK